MKSEKVRKQFAGNRRAFSHFRFFTFSLLFLLLVLPFGIYGATLAEYQEKVQQAGLLTADLLYLDEEDLTPAERVTYERERLAELRKTLPATEKVEWQGTSVEANNRWLQEKLDLYEREKDSSTRSAILIEISERLTSIEQKLNELENPSASNRTKDEDKRKLGEILRREEYQKPEIQEKSYFRKLIEKILEWFGKKSPRPDISSSKDSFESVSIYLQILLYAVILGGIGFLIYRFAPYLASRFNKREKREKKERVILGERIAADESAENIFSEAERLAREGNMRGAIRKGYIALLCELSDRKIIGLSHHKTNRDYLRDVRKRRELHENMNGLTSNFERHWYGAEEAEEKDWEEFRSGYKKAVSSQ
jgi:hypothetical protein